jgi:hypothetical protein
MLVLRKLSEILMLAHDLPHGGWLYLCGDYPWTGESLGIVYSSYMGDDLRLEHPEFVKANNLQSVLDIGDIKQILIYAQRQKPDLQLDELIQSFNHYYKHDGFLEL